MYNGAACTSDKRLASNLWHECGGQIWEWGEVEEVRRQNRRCFNQGSIGEIRGEELGPKGCGADGVR